MRHIRRTVAAAVLAVAAVLTTAAPAAARPAPKACTRALDNAERIIEVMLDYNEGVGAYFTASAASASRHSAGTYADLVGLVRDLTAASTDLTAVVEDAGDRAAPEAQAFASNAAKCRRAR